MSGISFTGVGSGLPVNDIVNGLVNAEKAPFESRSATKKTNLTTSISAVGTLKSELDKLQASLEDLSTKDKFQKRTVSGGDDFFSITSDKTAQTGQFDIQVNNLAKAHKVASASFTNEETLGTGTLSIGTTSGTSSFNVDVSSTDTLKDIRDKINLASDNESTIATILTDSDGSQRLVMTAKETGVENGLDITVSGASGRLAEFDKNNADVATKLTQLTPPLNASITIDGAITITNSTNEFKNAIGGITIDLKKSHDVDDNVSSIKVSENNDVIKETLKKFVEAYNAYNKLSDEIGESGGEEGSNGGVLSGDSMLRSLNSRLRTSISSSFSDGDTGTLTLSQLGVTADRYGKFSFDEDKLNEQLDKSPNAVQAFFLGEESTPGFSVAMTEMLNDYTKNDGLLDGRVDSYNSQVKDLEKSVESFDKKIKKLEARLFSQYNAMDLLVGSLKSTTGGVLQQLTNIPNYNRN
jgi:flagellar hook-associated protein 2